MIEQDVSVRLTKVEHQIRSLEARVTQPSQVSQLEIEPQLTQLQQDFAKLVQEFESHTQQPQLRQLQQDVTRLERKFELHIKQQRTDLAEIRQENPASMPWFYINLALIAFSTGLLSYFISSSLRSPHFSTIERTPIIGSQNP